MAADGLQSDADYAAANMQRFTGERERRLRAEGSLAEALQLIAAQADVIADQRSTLAAQAEWMSQMEDHLADERRQAQGQAPTALQEAAETWLETYPDWNGPDHGPHFYHSRGMFTDGCPGCVDELALLLAIASMDRGAAEHGGAAVGGSGQEEPALGLAQPAAIASEAPTVQQSSLLP